MAEGVQSVHLVFLIALGGDKEGAARAEGDVAAPLAHDARPDGSGGIVPRARDDFDVRREPQRCRSLFFQRADRLETLIELGQLQIGDAELAAHIHAPAAVLDVEEERPARIRNIGRERARKAVAKIVLGQHDLFDAGKILPFMLSHPKELGRGEAREGDVARVLGKLVLPEYFVQILGLLLRPAVVPEDGGADDFVLFVEDDEPVHLPAEGDAFDRRLVLPFEQRFEPAESGVVPVFGVLFAPAGLRIEDGIGLRIF